MRLFRNVYVTSLLTFDLISVRLLRREGIMHFCQLKEPVKLSTWEGFSFFGLILKEILTFKYCKISGWQKS